MDVSLVQDGRFTAGGGATEIEMARQIAAWGETHPGLEQYSISRSSFDLFRVANPASGIRCRFDPGSGIRNWFFPDP
jgi:hypothetical protein